MPTEPRPSVPQLLREYGAAIRGDWGSIDGRCVRDDMENLADWVEDPASVPADARVVLGICPAEGGHWTDYCTPDRCGMEGA